MANTYQLTQTGPQVQADLDAVEAGDIVYLTSAPTADNTSGKLKIVVLEEEPSTKYEGYIYIVKTASEPEITDLTGTKWLLNSSVSVYMQNYEYNLSFTSNNTSFAKIGIVYDIGSDMGGGSGPDNQGLDYYYPNSDSDRVYDGRNDTWSNQAYRTIKITGGTDVTNTELINWLQTNATQIPADSVSLISFMINKTFYQAEEGMTWAEWRVSEYNTLEDDGIITKQGSGGGLSSVEQPVASSDEIINGGVYSLTTPVDSGGSND